MQKLTIIIWAALLLCIVSRTHGFCFLLQNRNTLGKIAVTCRLPRTLFLLGETKRLKHDACAMCTCKRNGLYCCSTRGPLPRNVPSDCKVVPAPNCDYNVVKTKDESKDCYTGRLLVTKYRHF
ncbi:beta-microseminoprotein-like [Lingula anatina]|uniref:Beta-microseminoprotein-like n=1 Tax=Lingula anatina TaxID=7574 RepID=A0A1S3K746_LINAN|nr:beta-microseminoprotein-like [Lingula anatina]|eukprot:XP_013418455.1 beta-microseminoprotein-like [Lingula anatina]